MLTLPRRHHSRRRAFLAPPPESSVRSGASHTLRNRPGTRAVQYAHRGTCSRSASAAPRAAGGSNGELLLARHPGMTHGRSDATAAPGDLEVTAAKEALLELVCSPPSESEMRVAVNEPRNYQSPLCIEPLCVMKFRRQLTLGTNPPDRTLVPDQGGVGNGVDVTLRPLRSARGELGDVSQHLHTVTRSN